MRSLAYWLTLAFVFSVPWEEGIHLGEIGQLSKAIGLVAAAAWAVSVVARGRLRQPDAFQKAFFLFLVWNGLTFYWSIDSGATMSGFLTYTQIFGMLLIIWDLFDSTETIRTALQAYVLGAFVTSGAIVMNYMTTPPDKFPERRFLALGFQVDAIALIVAFAAPAAWYLAVSPADRPRSSALTVANYVYVPLGLFALVLTGTRGAVLASIPTVAFMAWSLRRIGQAKRIVAIGTVAIAAVVLVSFTPKEPLERIGTVTTATNVHNQGPLSGRWAIWMESRRAFLDRPIFGAGLAAHRAVLDSGAPGAPGETKKRSDSWILDQGLNARRAAIATGREAHNAYLSVLVETGLVGFVLLTCVIVIVLSRVRHLTGWEKPYWYTQLAVLAIGAMSLSIEERKDVWLFLALAVASGAAAERRELALEVSPPTLTAIRP